MNRAYSILQVKAFDDAARTFSGIATTPQVDRVGDVIDPLGAQFKNPISLLLCHDATQPVGQATFGKATKTGIPFTATIPTVTAPGSLQDRLTTAWESVKAGLIRGVSIGFRVLDGGYEFIENTGAVLFNSIEIVELSLVAIPCNTDATISQIKMIDTQSRAALGQKDFRVFRLPPPGVSGKNKTGVFRLPKPIAEVTNEHSGTTQSVS
jgi:HK97 family phage prohead protease